jgi:hypothetical protein
MEPGPIKRIEPTWAKNLATGMQEKSNFYQTSKPFNSVRL